jgi:hypothetical protein
MSTQQITTADNAFVGDGYDARAFAFWERKGVPVHFASGFSLGTPALGDADFLIKAATGTELPDAADPGETVTYLASADAGASPVDAAATTTTINGVTVWDVRDGATYGRNLVSVATHSSAVVAMTVLISGFDIYKQPMSELHTIAATGTSKTATGYKAFAYVSSIAITAAADASANTLNIGTGAKLGLPFRLTKKGHMQSVSLGGVQEQINVASNATVMDGASTTATTETGDVRGTVAFNTALDGSKEAFVWYHVAGHGSGAGLMGVAQA